MKGNKKTQGWNAVAKGLVWAMLLEMILSALLAALMAKGVVAESAMISVVAIMSGMASFLGSALAKRGRGAAEAMMTAVSFGATLLVLGWLIWGELQWTAHASVILAGILAGGVLAALMRQKRRAPMKRRK